MRDARCEREKSASHLESNAGRLDKRTDVGRVERLGHEDITFPNGAVELDGYDVRNAVRIVRDHADERLEAEIDRWHANRVALVPSVGDVEAVWRVEDIQDGRGLNTPGCLFICGTGGAAKSEGGR